MQTDIKNYLTKDRINNASFRQKLDPINKNILSRQNPLELVFEDISSFDAENPINGILLRELHWGKKLTADDLLKKAPGPPGVDFAIRNRLVRLRERKNNTSPSPPSPPTTQYFLPPPSSPPFFPFNFHHHQHHHQTHLYYHHHQLTKFFHHNLHYLHHLQVFVFRLNLWFRQIIYSALKHKHWQEKKKK